MSELMTTNGQLPAHLQEYASSSADDLISTLNLLPSLSIRGKQFTIRKGEEEKKYPVGQPLNVVILAVDPVGQPLAKTYYSKPYVSGSDEQPDCMSSDGITPDGHVDKPQARSCAECPHNVFGTAKAQDGSSGKGKACSEHKNLIVVLEDNIEHGDLLMLRVPVKSLKALSAFGSKLKAHNLPPQVFVTQLSFQDTEYPALDFNPVRYLNKEEAHSADARAKSDSVQMAKPSSIKVAFDPAKIAASPETDLLALPGGPNAVPETPKTPEVPETPKTLVLKDPESTLTFQDYYDKGWTDELLIEHGHAEYR